MYLRSEQYPIRNSNFICGVYLSLLRLPKRVIQGLKITSCKEEVEMMTIAGIK